MTVYAASMAPGLSWANYGADGGDLITAAATGGIAHPTGYPVYLLLARLFQFIPIGSLAFRTNLFSAITTIAAALVVYGLVVRCLSNSNPLQVSIAALASGFAFGLAPLIWSQAIITEVYGLHSLFVVLLLFISTKYSSQSFPLKCTDRWLGLTFGLAMGNHITTIFFLPVILSTRILYKTNSNQDKYPTHHWKLEWRSLVRRVIWLWFGLLFYVSLPLRALSKPPINWGNPVTLDGFAWLVSGKLYQANLATITISSILDRIQSFVALLLDQFGIPGLAIGLIGLIVFFKPNHLHFSMLWIMCVSLIFAVRYSSTHAIMYLIPFFICLAIWIGIGLGELMASIPQRFQKISPIFTLVIILSLFTQAGINWRQVDASQDQRAETFGTDVISLAPADAIVFAEGDQAVFSLWYFQYALHKRPDLAIISKDLLQFEWYFQTLQSTYPDLIIPVVYPFPETVILANSERPVCYIQYVQAEEINCFPARNPLKP